MRILSGFTDTRTNKEDFAITPYLFGVWFTGDILKVYGFGLCWGYYALFISIGFNLPKGYPFFKVYK